MARNWDTGECEERKTKRKQGKTYQHGKDDEEEVPNQVLLPTHPGMASLQSATRIVEEICIKHQAQLRAGDEEASYATPDLRGEPKQIIAAVYEGRHVQEAQVHR